jgi:hypothetical protein
MCRNSCNRPNRLHTLEIVSVTIKAVYYTSYYFKMSEVSVNFTPVHREHSLTYKI